jgi:putative phosphoribosyl transferase
MTAMGSQAAASSTREVEIRAAGVLGPGAIVLAGDLTVPSEASALVLFAHGSGSTRRSPRNRMVAERLNTAGMATLLFDLLTSEESVDRGLVFDIPFLAERLLIASQAMHSRPEMEGLPVGYFGASTGAGAALWAAAEPDANVSAVVSRGGRPDLAGPRLGQVSAPTLLLVGSLDVEVLELNRQAQAQLSGESELAVVPGASHLFEEPGTLERVADHAGQWFTRHLPPQ